MRRQFVALSLVVSLLFLSLPANFVRLVPAAKAAVPVSTTAAFIQNFDTIGSTSTAALPADFKADRTTTATAADMRRVGNYATAGAATTQAGGANLGTSATNGIYNLGSGTTATGADRAVGFLASGTATASGNLYAQLANNTGGGLSGLEISYDVEKYRNGSNAAGFRIQLFYSTDGANWTNAGTSFLTAFPSDSANTGFSPAPGVTVPVGSTLNVAIPSGGSFYLAWNYSVTTGSTVSNAQALAVDNISIKGVAATGATNPAGTGAAAPTQVVPGGTTVLTVAVTPGTNPTSTAHAVTANLSAIGGSSNQVFFDDGTNGDAAAGDNVFSYAATVAGNAAAGAKTLPFTVTETAPQSRTATGNISLSVLAQTSPAGAGTANPASLLPGAMTTLTVNVTPGANPPSTNLSVTADLSSIGGSATQAFNHDGANSYSFSATLPNNTTPGAKSLPVTITDGENRTGATVISLNVEQPPQPLDHIVISQVYGGGGNTSATFRNDYVELYNPTTGPVDLGGWTIQYASATGTTWQAQPLGGVMEPGQYYLVSLASGGAVGAVLPDANVTGDINMSGTNGKVALSSGGDPLDGCPTGDAALVDLVGYGTANCREGGTNAPTPGNNQTAIFRKSGGFADTNVNSADFQTGTPSPRRTTPIVEIGPYVLSVDPRRNTSSAARDASISFTFTEPVEVAAPWYDINCAATGSHNDATVSGSGRFWVVTPNANFQHGEQCSVTVFQNAVQDTDLEDADPGTNNLKADYVWTFTVTGAGAAAPYARSVHTAFGNPTDAEVNLNEPNNYLMEKDGFTLSYNRDKGTPNWVSWHLDPSWYGTLQRVDTFRPDPAVPADWYRVQASDYFSSGFDRGHMVPNADRDHQDSLPRNQETFLMTNMIPQSPDNNQGPWANLENYLRSVADQGNEVYVVAGPAGSGGAGSGGAATTIANGRVAVPSHTWKVALVLPRQDGDDVSRANAQTRIIAVIMPNVQGIRTGNANDWEQYLTTVDAVELLTGYDLFENLPDAVENAVEAGVNGDNPPGTEDGAFTTAEDTAASFTMTAAGSTPALTYTIVDGPTHGTLAGTGASRTYTPAADFHGTDSFTFRVSDGAKNSNVSTVSILVTPVNDAPSLVVPAAATVPELAAYTFTAQAADVDGDGLTYSLVGAPAGATIDSAGKFTWTPSEAQGGTNAPFEFAVRVSDGTSNFDAPVSITVTEVNQAPTLAPVGNKTVLLGNTLTFTAQGADADLPAQTLTYTLTGASPEGASIDPATGVFNWTPTAAQSGRTYTFGVRVTDDGAGALHAEETITVAAAYTWSGFLQPINGNGSSVFKLGRTVPVKFQLTGASVGVTNAVARLYVAKVANNVVGTEDAGGSTSNATAGNLFRYADGQYVFNLSTDGLTAGTYQLRVDTGDGVQRTVLVSLR